MTAKSLMGRNQTPLACAAVPASLDLEPRRAGFTAADGAA
jgi:hypothetical protein